MAKRKFEGGRVRVPGRWATKFYIMEERQQRGKKGSQGMCESTAWANRLKSGKKGCVSVNKTNR